MPRKPRALVISFTDLSRDARLDRQIGFLRETYDVVTAGTAPSAYRELEFVDLSMPPAGGVREHARRAVSLARLLVRRYRRVYWRHPVNRQALRRLTPYDVDVIVANDLSALPLACELAGDAAVVFDAHEYTPAEQADRLLWRLVMSPYVSGLLRTYLPRVDAMMTVSPGIAELYAANFATHPAVVTNAPNAVELGCTDVHDPVRLVHHGVADPSRRLELMIEAVCGLGDGFSLDLMLVPSNLRYLARLHEIAQGHPRIRILDPCPSREIVQTINQYDVGVYLLEPRSLNHELALPNKLFDFIQARLAIAIGPSPEMRRVVESWECGVVADDFSAGAFASALQTLTPERIAAFKRGADRAAGELTAERNRDVVLDVLDRALSARGRHPAMRMA